MKQTFKRPIASFLLISMAVVLVCITILLTIFWQHNRVTREPLPIAVDHLVSESHIAY